MNYDVSNELLELKEKFLKIRSMGYIKGINNNASGAGLTLENLLGIEMNNYCIPDYKGIEIKTKMTSNDKPLGLFCLVPASGKQSLENIATKFGKHNNYGKLSFNVTCSYNEHYDVDNNIYIVLETSDDKDNLFLSLYNNKNELIDRSIYWSIYEIYCYLVQKLNCMAVFRVWATRKTDSIYYKYYDLLTYYLVLDKDKTIDFITKKLILKIHISTYKYGKIKGKIHDHGSTFMIKMEDIQSIFKKA